MGWSGGSFSRTNGTHTGSTVWAQDRDAGTKITASNHDTHDQDLADGINATIAKDGSNAFTGAADLGSQRITNLADGTARTDGTAAKQVQDGELVLLGSVTGADTITATQSPTITAYADGQQVEFVPAGTNTGAVTLNIDSVGAKSLKKQDGGELRAGDLTTSNIVKASYDSTIDAFLLHTQVPSDRPDPVHRDNTDQQVVNTTTETNVFSYTIPAGRIAANDVIRYRGIARYDNNTGGSKTITVRVKLGSTTIATFALFEATNANPRGIFIEVDAFVVGTSNTNIICRLFKNDYAALDGTDDNDGEQHFATYEGCTEDLTAAKAFVISADPGAADANLGWTSFGQILEII